MKKWLYAGIVVLLIAAAIYTFIYFFVIPKTAAFLVPNKWKSITAGQKKVSYYSYLGNTDSSLREVKGDMWFAQNGNYHYVLKIVYNADTVGKFYGITCRFKNSLFDKTVIIKTGSLSNEE